MENTLITWLLRLKTERDYKLGIIINSSEKRSATFDEDQVQGKSLSTQSALYHIGFTFNRNKDYIHMQCYILSEIP